MATLYGLVDAAQDHRLFGAIDDLDDRACLFSGPLDAAIRRVAPYVVNLENSSGLSDFWEREGRGKNWGLQCFFSGTLDEARSHFHKLLEVELPNDDVVMFRYFDPRVFVPYIDSCDADELRRWFAGVHYFRVPDGPEERPVFLSLREDALAQTEAEPARPTLVARTPGRSTTLKIRPEQMAALSDVLRRRADHDLASYASARFPALLGAASLRERLDLAGRVRAKARSFGVEREDNVATFLDFSVMYGEDFDRADWAADVLGAQVLHGPDKIALLRHRVELTGVTL